MSNPITPNNATPLPAHIRQLVDKKNYVIAIKTHAEEQNISMEDAKNQIDAYEQQATRHATNPSTNAGKEQAGVLNQLNQSLDSHLQQENIKVPLIPRWVWRVSVIILVMVIIGYMLYRFFA